MDDLIELAVRTVQSILLDPPERPLNPVALRNLVGRWLGPAVLYHQLTRDIDALTALTHASQMASRARGSAKLA
jgi:hypothetical protein